MHNIEYTMEHSMTGNNSGWFHSSISQLVPTYSIYLFSIVSSIMYFLLFLNFLNFISHFLINFSVISQLNFLHDYRIISNSGTASSASEQS